MQIKTMFDEMEQDLKALRFVFPVKCGIVIVSDGPAPQLESHYTVSGFLGRVLAGLVVHSEPIHDTKDFRLKVSIHTGGRSMSVSEARMMQYVYNEVVTLAGFFEMRVHDRVFEI